MRRPYAHLCSSRRRARPWLVAMLLVLLFGISYFVVNKQPSTEAIKASTNTTTAGPSVH